MAYLLETMQVEWDPAKERINVRKHGISFAEAQTLFTSGADYLELYDGAHSELEDRFVAIGPLPRGLVLVVYTERSGPSLRIISARWATRREENSYRQYLAEQR